MRVFIVTFSTVEWNPSKASAALYWYRRKTDSSSGNLCDGVLSFMLITDGRCLRSLNRHIPVGSVSIECGRTRFVSVRRLDALALRSVPDLVSALIWPAHPV
jgi:hypothetical protein